MLNLPIRCERSKKLVDISGTSTWVSSKYTYKIFPVTIDATRKSSYEAHCPHCHARFFVHVEPREITKKMIFRHRLYIALFLFLLVAVGCFLVWCMMRIDPRFGLLLLVYAFFALAAASAKIPEFIGVLQKPAKWLLRTRTTDEMHSIIWIWEGSVSHSTEMSYQDPQNEIAKTWELIEKEAPAAQFLDQHPPGYHDPSWGILCDFCGKGHLSHQRICPRCGMFFCMECCLKNGFPEKCPICGETSLTVLG